MASLPKSEDVINQASQKLKIIEHQRELEDKFFQRYEEKKEFLNKFEQKLSQSLYYDKINSSNINEKTFSKIVKLLGQFSKLDQKYINNMSKILINKNSLSVQTDSTDESILINKISVMEKSHEKLSKENTKYKRENEILQKENLLILILNN